MIISTVIINVHIIVIQIVSLNALSVSTAPPWTWSTASRTLFWSWFGLIPLHCRPINSNNNTLAVFPLPCIRKVLRIHSWFHLTTIFQPTSRRRYFTHVAHHCLHDRRSVTHFPLSTRSDDENYHVGAILHQCCWESIVRFLVETIVCIINAFKALSSAFESCKKLPRVYISVLPGKFPTFMTSFLTLWHHPLEGPFSPDGSHLSIISLF